MSALSSTFTSYLSYVTTFFISGTVAASGKEIALTVPDKAVTVVKTTIEQAVPDPMLSILVRTLLVFFEKADVVVVNGAVYLHGILVTQVLTCSIALVSLFMIVLKGILDLALIMKKWRLDKLERDMADLGDD